MSDVDLATPTLSGLVSEIVSNYVANNAVEVTAIPGLIQSVYSTLNGLGKEPAVEAISEKATAAQIRKSVKPDGLVSFIDGKSYKTLKRHLTKHGLTVAEYKDRFGLPKDYPTTANDYSAKRSAMASAFGLGRKPTPVAAAAPAPKVTKPKAPTTPAPKVKAKATARAK
jgi:predicted transcriptional regulator